MRFFALAGLIVLATPAHAVSTVTATWYGNELWRRPRWNS
jgi:hypothetical protein